MNPSPPSTNGDSAPEHITLVRSLRKQLTEVESQLGALQLDYRRAGHNLRYQVEDDVARIREVREEVSQISTILRGTELFGRYAQDADHHLLVANKWRQTAVCVLLIAPLLAILLNKVAGLDSGTMAVVLAPVITLFIYASIESGNHRRREFDRRRIALRVSAIEAFTKQRRESGSTETQQMKAEKLLDEFVRKHFIHPELDSNDMAYFGSRFSLVRVRERKPAPPHEQPS